MRITTIIDKVLDYNPDTDVNLIERAYIYSARVHDGQTRLSGEPYLTHPLAVAGILADLRLDAVSIAAGLLHDVIEDTFTTEEDIEKMFGAEVKHIVAGVTKISKLPFQTSEYRQAESFRKMVLAMSYDIRVILIKLADRLHNMRTLKYHKKPEKVLRICQETLDIYSPIAARLGMFKLKNELDDIAFRYMKPEVYKEIEEGIAKDKEERGKLVEEIRKIIEVNLREEGIIAEVLGRYKQIPSIYQKMVQQKLKLSEIYDLTAFRIILDTEPQCYYTMGLVHNIWNPIYHKFKDYIGAPKPNGYRSLHTTVLGPSGERMEIQIRTKEMDYIAKSGIAAHWSYKEGLNADMEVTKSFAWIQDLVENYREALNPEEFMENVRLDLFSDEVYVFTPKGEVKSLPIGATPVDFAYSVHTEIGDQCTGAKINGRMFALNYTLKNGDIVEIITTKGHEPSKDWLGFVKTVKARNRIKSWIKNKDREFFLSVGRSVCEKTFRKHKLNFTSLMNTERMREIAEHFNFKNVEDLLINVGYGKITSTQILREYEPKVKSEAKPNFLQKFISAGSRKKKHSNDKGIIVKGVDDVLVRFGKCCQPLPGDPIIGYVTMGQGISVHHCSCNSLKALERDRYIEVEWSEGSSEHYPVKIEVASGDRSGLLMDLATAITSTGADIVASHTITERDDFVSSHFTVDVTGRELLEKVIIALKGIEDVISVKRTDS